MTKKPEERLETVAERLRAHGYRLTPQRMAVLRAVLGSPSHPTAEDIYRRVSADFPMLSLATVYKTLDVVGALGEVIQLDVAGCSHYDGDLRPHAHLICIKCHSITDLPSEVTVEMPQEALADTRFRVLWHAVGLHGLCARCQVEADARKESTRVQDANECA